MIYGAWNVKRLGNRQVNWINRSSSFPFFQFYEFNIFYFYWRDASNIMLLTKSFVRYFPTKGYLFRTMDDAFLTIWHFLYHRFTLQYFSYWWYRGNITCKILRHRSEKLFFEVIIAAFFFLMEFNNANGHLVWLL